MVVVVTRDVAPRFRGFLASCMLEIAPGVYTAPRMNAAVRDRVWSVLAAWHAAQESGAIVMTWREPTHPAGQEVRALGTFPVDLTQHEGVILARRSLTPQEILKLQSSRKGDDVPF